MVLRERDGFYVLWLLSEQLKEGSERNRVLREEQGVYKALVVVHAFV